MPPRPPVECSNRSYFSTPSKPAVTAAHEAAICRRQTGNRGRTAAVTALLLGLHLLQAAVLEDPAAAAPQGDGAAKAPVVNVMVVTQAEVNPPAEYVGRVEAIQAVDLRARVEGFLEQVKFKEGGDVRAGEVLYLIEKAPYLARVHEAKAKVADADAALTNARQYLQRLRVVRSGGVSATDLDAAVSAELRAEAQLQEARANLENAELDLSYTAIGAPIDGRIGRTAFTKGNLVGPGSGALARIVQLDPIRVVYSMSESEFGAGQEVLMGRCDEDQVGPLEVRIQTADGNMFPTTGRLDFVDNQVDAGTGTIAVRVVFDNPHGILLPGQYVNTLVRCREGKRLPVVPQSAVQEDRDGRYVFVVDTDKRVELRRIRTGAAIGTQWAVESGLAAGERVIVQGVQKVRPGQIVEIETNSGQAGE